MLRGGELRKQAMSDQHSRRRAWGEKHIQPQAGGTFLVRPFGLFGGVYELPHAAARDRYVENGLRSESWCVSFIVGAFFLPFVVVYWLRLPSQWWGLAAILPVFAVFAAVAAMHWRLLRHIAATRVPRSRWFGSAVRDPSGFSTLGWLRVRLVLWSC